MQTQSITNRATHSANDDGHTVAQPVPTASTVAAIVTADTAKRDATKAKQAAKRTASKPATVKASKQNGKQSAVKLATAKAKPAKPVNAADDKQRAERVALIDNARAYVARFYGKASLAIHAKRPLARQQYVDRCNNPVQRANSETERDSSGLAYLLSIANKQSGAFDPCAGSGCDAGVISRLASLKLIAFDAKADAFMLTSTGLSRARAIVKRAA